MPLAAPVTTATFPRSSFMADLLAWDATAASVGRQSMSEAIESR
jgi:hypothetical protein